MVTPRGIAQIAGNQRPPCPYHAGTGKKKLADRPGVTTYHNKGAREHHSTLKKNSGGHMAIRPRVLLSVPVSSRTRRGNAATLAWLQHHLRGDSRLGSLRR